MADEETVSSPATDTSPPAADTGESATPSPPSPAETPSDPGTSKESLLDAVLKVVPATNETDVLAKTDAEAPPEATEPDSQQAEDEPETDSDDDDEPPSPEVPAATRKKINKLLRQRRELRNELSQLKPAAQIGAELQTFSEEHGLTGDDLAQLLHLGATLRAGDYKAFYTAIAPYVRTAQEVLGVVLPKDLQDMVRNGQMTETAAKAYARDRISGKRAEYDLQATTQANQRQQVQAVQGDVRRAVASFETRLSASDPDYKAKAPVVRRVAQAMLLERGNTISSVQEALEVSKAAYDEVNRQMRSFQPVPRATHPMPNGASQTPSARAAPKSMMEAALQALDNSRRGG
jgi:hypothetical protein